MALGAILWRLRCAGTWSRLPARFGSASTARRRLRSWSRDTTLANAWRGYLSRQSVAELERWRDAFDAEAWRAERERHASEWFWRLELDVIWRREFAPRVSADA